METKLSDTQIVAPIHNHSHFNEDEWIRILFLLSDTQQWLNDLAKGVILQIPTKDKKKLFHKSYCITVNSLAHILERHYYKILRHPASSKFTISVAEILLHLRNARLEQTVSIPGSLNFQRVINARNIIGFDQNQIPTTYIKIVTDGGGRIITAYPYNPNI